MNKKESGIAHLLVILILLAGLVAAVYLIQQKTNFFPRAASGPSNPITPTPSPFIKITNPTTGSILNIGQTIRIKWDYYGNKKIDIYVRATNNPENIQRILTRGENVGYFDWTVGGQPANRDYTILIYGSDGSMAESGAFRVNMSSPFLTITSPTASTVWTQGQKVDITWNSSGNKYLDIYIRAVNNPNNIQRILTRGVNTGSFEWTVANVSSLPRQYQVLLRGSDGSEADSAPFMIKPELEITKPAAGEVIKKGLYKITWIGNATKVDLYWISDENPSSTGLIVGSLPNLNYYNWNNLSVPIKSGGEKMRILIRSTGSNTPWISSGAFTLIP